MKTPKSEFEDRSALKAFMHPATHVSGLIVFLIISVVMMHLDTPWSYFKVVPAFFALVFALLLCWRIVKEAVNSVDL